MEMDEGFGHITNSRLGQIEGYTGFVNPSAKDSLLTCPSSIVNKLSPDPGGDMTFKGLDSEQALAAGASVGPVVIMAGAGTGKTTTLTARIAELIERRGASPDSIVAVTFTNKAAAELRERLKARIGAGAVRLRLGTFHSISARILRSHAVEAGLQDRNFVIVDEEEAAALMFKACESPSVTPPFVPPEGDAKTVEAARKSWASAVADFAVNARRRIQLWKAWGLTDAAANEPSALALHPDDARFAAAYAAYQYELESRNSVDFGDLILKVVELFRTNDKIRELESSMISHLLVDEAQDANPVQVAWVRMMSSWFGSVTAVGDFDQSIYGFQGGYPAAIHDMVGPNAATFELRRNRRCTDEILRPANMLVDYNRRKAPKVLASGRSGGPVCVTSHVTDVQEAAWMAGRIKEIVAAGGNPTEIAILLRASWQSAPIEEAMLRAGIRVKVVRGSSLLDREEIKDVANFVRLAVRPFDEMAFRRIANRPVRGLGPAAVEAICRYASSRSVPFGEACHAAADKRSGTRFRADAKAGAAALGRALTAMHEDVRWDRPAYDVVATAVRDTGYLEALRETPGAEDKVANVEALLRLSEAFPSAIAFLHDTSLMSDGDVDESTDAVRISTIHSSKGLEFDHVFCPGFDQDVTPSLRATQSPGRATAGDVWNGPSGGGIEEERRLAHVAFTRARHALYVSFPLRRTNGKGKTKPTGPSSFIQECDFSPVEAERMSVADLGRKAMTTSRVNKGYDR
jgi:DNA helicase-2/ATP-dependent DNA helicase PcrA